MHIKCNRIVCFLLALVLALSCMMEVSLPAAAAYENTHRNTGDQRYDIVSVALTQVGYKEGPGNSNGNDTKYGEWWGHNPMAWCAVFVSWCADQAGVPESVLKQSSFSNAGAFGFSSSFTAYQKTPKPGDLFFRNTNAHVGIVYKVEGNVFYTVEGNTWTSADPRHGVMIRQRDLYSSQFTFVSPNYGGSSNGGGGTANATPPSCNHNYVKGADAEHPHKEYYKCSKCGHQYYTGTNKIMDDCILCKQENCNHKFGQWQKVDDTYHSAVCSLCEKVSKESHNWGSDEVIKEATCVEPGEKKQTCQDCKHTRTTEIPATGEHTFGQIVYIDSNMHRQVCEICEYSEEAHHTLGDWSSSASEHWNTCSECGGRVNIGSHILSGRCGTACMICEHTPNTGHMYSANWSSNAQTHWQRCIKCATVKNEGDHVYSAECDETCDTCGYVRRVTHSYGSQWQSDGTSHWKECTRCGHVKDMKTHTPGPKATEIKGQYCTTCQYEMAPIQAHTHNYKYSYDASTHWGVCSCGDQRPSVEHTWQMGSNTCAVCDAPYPVLQVNPVVFGLKLPAALKTQWMWNVLLIAFGAIILLVILAILFGMIRGSIQASAAARLRREFDEEDEWGDDPDTYEVLPDNSPA